MRAQRYDSPTMETEFLPYSDGDVACEAYVARDPSKSGPRPAVLVFHAWGGQDDFARAKAEHLARLGYLGVAIDMYGKGLRPDTQEACAKAMTPFVQDRALLLRVGATIAPAYWVWMDLQAPFTVFEQAGFEGTEQLVAGQSIRSGNILITGEDRDLCEPSRP